jgi:glucose/mannose transport system permease protein
MDGAAGPVKATLVGPQGPRPRRWWAPSRIFIYSVLLISAAFFLLPLYVVIVTSLKDIDEFRYSSIFALPTRPTIEPWIKAWDYACTGLYCEGMKVGFWVSVRITVPSVALSIFAGSICGYVLAIWRYRGAEFFFVVMLFCIFIPPQVFFYPLVQALGAIRLVPSVWAAILAHTILSVPFMTLLFRNGFAALPPDLYRAARVDGAGFWRVYAQILMPLSLPILGVALVLQVTAIWNDYFLSAILAGTPFPMTMQFHNITYGGYGVKEYNLDMAATVLTGAVPLLLYFFCGRLFVRGVAAGVMPRRL